MEYPSTLWNYVHEDNVEKSKLFELDPYLSVGIPKFREIRQRVLDQLETIGGSQSALDQFSRGYEYFGFNYDPDKHVYTFREWLPGAKEVYLTGDFNNWSLNGLPLQRNEFGIWETTFPGDYFPLMPGCKYKLYFKNARDEWVYRNPAYAERLIQQSNTNVFDPTYVTRNKFQWKHPVPKKSENLKIYECHIGLSSEREEIATFDHFRTEVLPKINELGYNAIQIMAVAEHAYYGSFGYHVTNFFAVSSRFGTIEEFQRLVDEAHGLGLLVLMDIVHSHASSNAMDGIGEMDGTNEQYFHPGAKGYHRDWDSKLFDYGKYEVLRFLLSNIRWWVEEFNIDGFRYDGVTSILYKHHGELTRRRLWLHWKSS